MCKVDGKVKSFCDVLNGAGEGIAYHARNEYDAFLERCLEPYGIDKINASLYADRVRIEEENPHIEGFGLVSYQRFYIDGKYEFTVVFKQKPVNERGFITGTIVTYEKIVELDRVPKEKPMTNKEAISYIKRIITGDSKPDIALKMAVEALEEQDKYKWIFGELPDPKWNKTIEEVEKALGFKLFYWQKTFILHACSRRTGSTTALILRDLLRDTEATPIDYTRPAPSKQNDNYRHDLLKIKEKLDKAGIKTREVWRCQDDKIMWHRNHPNFSGFWDFD